MKQYKDLLQHIMNNGEDRPDRTGTGTRAVFGAQMRFDLNDGFPAVTTKRLAFKSVLSELLWMLEGSGDERRLAEILYGKNREELKDKNTIWSGNANAPYWTDKAKYPGDLGRVYGVQWRDWTSSDGTKVDQIKNLVNGLKNDPFSRRHMVTAWNPGELKDMALPPCHFTFMFYVSSDFKLSCQAIMRSNDIFLGQPFNIAFYSMLTHMLAQVCGYGVGEFILTVNDAHIYKDHFDAVNEQLKNEPLELPTLWLNPDVKDIFSFTMNDLKLENYNHHKTIKAKMSV